MIDTKYFKYLIVLANVRSLHKAADLLYISQPALSVALRKFEKQLGFRLFERSSNGIKPTAFCESLLPLAKEILNKNEEFELKCAQNALLTNYDLSKMTLTISSYPLISSVVLSDALSLLKLHLPQLKFKLCNLDMLKPVPSPRDNELIISFESRSKLSKDQDGDIEQVEICPVKSIIFMHPDFLEPTPTCLSEADLLKLPIISILKEYPTASVITNSHLNYLLSKNKDLNIIDVTSAATASSFVRNKIGVCFGLQLGNFTPSPYSSEIIPVQVQIDNPEEFSFIMTYKKTLPKELVAMLLRIFQKELIFSTT